MNLANDSLDNHPASDEPHWFPTDLQGEKTLGESPNTEDTSGEGASDIQQTPGLIPNHRFSEFSSWSSEEGTFTCMPNEGLLEQQEDLQLPPIAMEWSEALLPRDPYERLPKIVSPAQWVSNGAGKSQNEDSKSPPTSNRCLTALDQPARGRLSEEAYYCSPSMDMGSSMCRSTTGSLPRESSRSPLCPVARSTFPQQNGNRHSSPSTNPTEILSTEANEICSHGRNTAQYEGHIAALESKLRSIKRRQEEDLSAGLPERHAVHIYRHPSESYYTEYEKLKLKSFPRDMLTSLGMTVRFGHVPKYTAEDIEPQLSDGERHEVPIEPPRISSPCPLDTGNEDLKPIPDFPSEPPVNAAVESPRDDPNIRYLHYETGITKLQTIDFGRLGLAEIGGAQEAEGLDDSSEMGQTFDMYAAFFFLVYFAAHYPPL